jgi:redox-sensitive bicupin YhaK (pirin superfamily)
VNIREIATTIEPQVARDGCRRPASLPSRRVRSTLVPFPAADQFGSTNACDYEAGFPMHPHRASRP